MKQVHKPFASKLRQLHSLERQIQRLNAEAIPLVSYRKLVLKFRSLVGQLRSALPSRYWLRSAVAIALFLQVSISEVTGQQFAEPLKNPFGLNEIDEELIYTSADIDGDGDMDIFGFGYDGNTEELKMRFYENFGNSSQAEFGPFEISAFGISLTGIPGYNFIARFADFDDDGDLDLIASVYYDYYYNQIFTYFENIGNSTTPEFGPPQLLVLASEQETGAGTVFLGDIDDDGDIDLFSTTPVYDYNSDPNISGFQVMYYENVGSPESFDFTSGVLLPYGIEQQSEDFPGFSELGDIDGDGDLDLLISEFNYYINQGRFGYQENTGSSTEPVFSPKSFNPFGLSGANAVYLPQLIDFDLDGDLDIFATGYDYDTYELAIFYFENLGTSAVKDLSELSVDISLSPNPVSDHLQVTLSDGGLQLTNLRFEIFDNVGRRVYNSEHTNGDTWLDVGHLPVGLYSLSMICDQGQLSKKFVKVE